LKRKIPIPILNLNQLAFIQIVVGAAAAVFAGWLFGPRLGASTAIGAGLMLFNVVFLGWSWQRLMAKKSIAWTVMIIVIKYAVLLGSVFFLARTNWFIPLGAGLGILSFVVAALILALRSYRREGEFG
jgi:hypothetical protein